MSYPESSIERTEIFKYLFTVYKNDQKIHTDYYNLEGAREMKRILQKDNEVFEIYEADENGYLEETYL